MRLSLSLRARPAATLAALLLVGALAAPSAALASPPDHGNAGGNNGGNNGVACDEPPAGGGNPGQGNAGQGNGGEVGNVCDHDRDSADPGDGSSTSDPDGSGDDPDTDDPDTDDPDTDDPDTDDPDTDDPDTDTDDPDTDDPDTGDPDTGGALCDDLLVTLSPTATEGNGRAVAITSQTLEAGVPGWAAASWEAASGTTLTAVFARTAAGDVSLPPTATGSAVGIEALTFCGTTSGTPDDGAPEQPPGSETERGTGGGGKDTPARPTPGPDTTPRGATPPATSTTAATAATPASTTPASTPATSATAVEPTEGDADETEDAEVLGIQLAAAGTPDPQPADTDAPAAVADVLPIADERGGVAGLVVGGGLALAALIGLLLIAWRRRRNDTQEVTA